MKITFNRFSWLCFTAFLVVSSPLAAQEEDDLFTLTPEELEADSDSDSDADADADADVDADADADAASTWLHISSRRSTESAARKAAGMWPA